MIKIYRNVCTVPSAGYKVIKMAAWELDMKLLHVIGNIFNKLIMRDSYSKDISNENAASYHTNERHHSV